MDEDVFVVYIYVGKRGVYIINNNYNFLKSLIFRILQTNKKIVHVCQVCIRMFSIRSQNFNQKHRKADTKLQEASSLILSHPAPTHYEPCKSALEVNRATRLKEVSQDEV